METPQRSLLYKLLLFPGLFLIGLFNWFVKVFGLDVDVIPDSNIPFDDILTRHHELIKKEFEKVYLNKGLTNIEDFYKVNTDIGIDDQWKAFPFVMWNLAFKENINTCPFTYDLIRQIPGCTSAMFSLLLPGKHIVPHKGVYKGVIRCLFTLSVKDGGDCWIKVNGKQYAFEEGKAIYFDEVFEHEVKNNTNEIRAALYLDVYRQLPFPLNIYNRLLFYLYSRSPYMQTIINSYKEQNKTTIGKHKPKKAIRI